VPENPNRGAVRDVCGSELAVPEDGGHIIRFSLDEMVNCEARPGTVGYIFLKFESLSRK
jgi:hypothetical protein